MKNKDLVLRAMELTDETDERLLSMATNRYRGASKYLNADPVSRKAARQVLRTRGYIFDSATGQNIGRQPGSFTVRRVVVGTDGAHESVIYERNPDWKPTA